MPPLLLPSMPSVFHWANPTTSTATTTGRGQPRGRLARGSPRSGGGRAKDGTDGPETAQRAAVAAIAFPIQTARLTGDFFAAATAADEDWIYTPPPPPKAWGATSQLSLDRSGRLDRSSSSLNSSGRSAGSGRGRAKAAGHGQERRDKTGMRRLPADGSHPSDAVVERWSKLHESSGSSSRSARIDRTDGSSAQRYQLHLDAAMPMSTPAPRLRAYLGLLLT